MIDFGKLSAKINSSISTNPTEIFMALPSKASKYTYLRNVQSEVLDQWFSQRDNKDTIIKMNTGSGKTTVALLILKSCLTERRGQAVYVVPDNYLVEQVVSEAKALGIQVCTTEKDMAFLQGEAILVINIQKLINGKSVFGMRFSNNVNIDYVLIDDVHACVDDVKSQFSLRIERGTDLWAKIFKLYQDDLRNQNEKGYLDIVAGDVTSGCMPIPFWRVSDTKSELLRILREHKEDGDIMFNFPLVADCLQYCNCIFTYRGIEIEPYAVPIQKISSFVNAKRRIFMSATLCDDSQLVSVFDIDPRTTVITPKLASDIGDRMILFPQAYSPNITDEEVKQKLVEYSQRYSVVVIVPSHNRATFWSSVTTEIYTAINIKEGVAKMRSQKTGLYVLINKYDGIDLPDDACRIIVLDGLPDARTALDRLKEHYLQETIAGQKEKIQKIEQGMGRGVRSTADYCGVIIMGSGLIQILYSQNACDSFSAATKKQNEVSGYLAQQLKGKGIDEIFSTLEYCITQAPEWVSLSRGALNSLTYDKELHVDEFAIGCRKAFDQAVLLGQFEQARDTMRTLVNNTDDSLVKGYLMLEQAKYSHFCNPTEAQRVLASAQKYNHHLLKPITGVKSVNIMNKIKPQANQIIENYCEKDVNDYLIDLNNAIDSLIFAPSSYKAFETALKNLGLLLGWGAERPDDEYGVGPDVLWYMGDMKYAVIECKNEATAEKISKDYCAQLLSSVSWFKTTYPTACACVPVIVYHTNCFDYHASPASEFRVLTAESLAVLKQKTREFGVSLSTNGMFKNPESLSKLLVAYKFTANCFFDTYTESYVVK